MFFYAISWRALLNFLSVKISVVKSYLYVWYGIFIDIIIPAESISGEVCRIYLVTREQDGTSGKVVASLITHRLLGMGINIAVLIIGIGLLFGETQVDRSHFQSNPVFHGCYYSHLAFADTSFFQRKPESKSD